MIDYGEKPSNQMQMPISDGYDLMQEVREGTKENPESWKHYLDIALMESAYGEVSPNYAIQILRHRYKVSIKNAYAPALARIAMEQNPNIRFRVARSKVDGFCKVAL